MEATDCLRVSKSLFNVLVDPKLCQTEPVLFALYSSLSKGVLLMGKTYQEKNNGSRSETSSALVWPQTASSGDLFGNLVLIYKEREELYQNLV